MYASHGSRGRRESRGVRNHRFGRRGVSPIIAMILLVAITVILAAVLYVLVTGLVHGPASKPIAESFLITSPTAGTCWTAGVTAHVCGVKGNQLYNFTIQEAASVTLGDILLEVRTATGSVYHNSLAAAFAVMKIGSTTPVAYYTIAAASGLAMTKTFTINAGYSTATPISTSMYVVVGTGTAATSWSHGQGNYVTVLGTGHYSGSTAAQVLP
jgi:flagellin-like protein